MKTKANLAQQTVYSCINQPVNHLMDCSAGMQQCLMAVGVRLFGKTRKPGHDELIELGRAADQIELRSEIITEKEPHLSLLL